MPVIAVANQKGGVGKTTTTLNLGAALQEAGKRVLLLDLDPQGNLSVAAGLPNPDDAELTIGDLLLATSIRSGATNQTLRDAIIQSPCGLDLVPSNGKLSAAELAMVSALSRELMLRALLKPVKRDYDYILVDCLPSLGLVVINALAAADGLVIPVQADYLAMQGLGQILETVGAVQERLNPDLEVNGILLTLVDQRTAHAREVVSTIRESFEGVIRVFDAEIRMAVVLKDSVKAGVSILQFNGNSDSARAYRSLAREVLAVHGDAPSEPIARPAGRQPDTPAPVATVAAALGIATQPTGDAQAANHPSAGSPSAAAPEPHGADVGAAGIPAAASAAVAPTTVEPAGSQAPPAGPASAPAAAPPPTVDATDGALAPPHRGAAPEPPRARPALIRAAPAAPPPAPAPAPAAPSTAARPRTLLTAYSTQAAQARAIEIAQRTATPAAPVAPTTAPAPQPAEAPSATPPAPFAEFLAGRLQWTGSDENPTR